MKTNPFKKQFLKHFYRDQIHKIDVIAKTLTRPEL